MKLATGASILAATGLLVETIRLPKIPVGTDNPTARSSDGMTTEASTLPAMFRGGNQRHVQTTGGHGEANPNIADLTQPATTPAGKIAEKFGKTGPNNATNTEEIRELIDQACHNNPNLRNLGHSILSLHMDPTSTTNRAIALGAYNTALQFRVSIPGAELPIFMNRIREGLVADPSLLRQALLAVTAAGSQNTGIATRTNPTSPWNNVIAIPQETGDGVKYVRLDTLTTPNLPR